MTRLIAQCAKCDAFKDANLAMLTSAWCENCGCKNFVILKMHLSESAETAPLGGIQDAPAVPLRQDEPQVPPQIIQYEDGKQVVQLD